MDPLTGRIAHTPSCLLHEDVLAPQFRYEAEHLLPWYVLIEKVLLLEYHRMGLLAPDEVTRIAVLLDSAPATLVADPGTNLSDIAFALERHVADRYDVPAAWHVDRSRNDLQACAQLLFGREQVTRCAAALRTFARSAYHLATGTVELPMPGYTHLQAAQVITPGFYLAAVVEQALHSLGRMLQTYDGINVSPLGAGAMAGQELPWDTDRMARLVGFNRAGPHALTSVASRGWVLEVTADLSILGVALSRFVTDLMTWGGSEYGFIDLPDELSGISSAMPQKKNFPILERIRGRTAHLSAFHIDVVLSQRATPYTNTVEVSKEAGTHLLTTFETARSTLRLFTAVLDTLRFRAEPMRAACEREYLGGYTLANLLTLREHVPWRQAQVMAGRYVAAAVERGLPPCPGDPQLLHAVAGRAFANPEGLLAEVFDVERNLRRKRSAGSAHPDAVRELLANQAGELNRLAGEWDGREQEVRTAVTRVADEIGDVWKSS